jgi:predicted Zn-dependent protease
MKRSFRRLIVVSVVLVVTFAITVPVYASDYCFPAPYNSGYYGTRQGGIVYLYYNATLADQYKNAYNAAFPKWNTALAATGSGGTVKYSKLADYNTFNAKKRKAVLTAKTDPKADWAGLTSQSGRHDEKYKSTTWSATVYLNASFFSHYTSAEKQNTALHELGHVVLLGHYSNVSNAIMYYKTTSLTTISSVDKVPLRNLYTKKW